MHHAQFKEYGSPSTMVTIGGAESAPPRGKEDILKAVGIRVKNIQARKSDNSHHEVCVNERGKQAEVQKDTLNIQCSPGPRRMTSMIIQA